MEIIFTQPGVYSLGIGLENLIVTVDDCDQGIIFEFPDSLAEYFINSGRATLKPDKESDPDAEKPDDESDPGVQNDSKNTKKTGKAK